MSKLSLSLALWRNPRVARVMSGQVKVEGVDLMVTNSTPADTFWRQLRFAEFDISEMSMASLSIAVAKGEDRWVAIPVFTDRKYFHANVLVRKGSGIAAPRDLIGRRVSIPDYQQTGALWVRGMLQHDFDVKPADMHWFQERTPGLSHGSATGFVPPEGVRVDQMPAGDTSTDMMLRGELDATMMYIPYPTLIDRSSDPSDITDPLFPDRDAETTRAFRKWGFLPPNHCVIVRRELAEKYPWLPLNIFNAFNRALADHRQVVINSSRLHREVGLVDASSASGLQQNLFPYGMAANKGTLTTIADFLVEQGLIPRRVEITELIHPSLMDT